MSSFAFTVSVSEWKQWVDSANAADTQLQGSLFRLSDKDDDSDDNSSDSSLGDHFFGGKPASSINWASVSPDLEFKPPKFVIPEVQVSLIVVVVVVVIIIIIIIIINVVITTHQHYRLSVTIFWVSSQASVHLLSL